jgi:hypothetical protein
MRRTAGILLAMLALSACNKRGSDAEDVASSRGLQVEAYDPVIPKAPVKGKLETMASHPEDGAAASSEPAPAESSQPPPPRG